MKRIHVPERTISGVVQSGAHQAQGWARKVRDRVCSWAKVHRVALGHEEQGVEQAEDLRGGLVDGADHCSAL